MLSAKTLRNRYFELEGNLRKDVTFQIARSGNLETISELDQLLDDLIFERDEDLHTQKEQKDKEDKRKILLQGHVERIRD